MKFGKTLTTHQIPEWSINYINYKGLKKIINLLPQDSVLASFFFELDRNIEKVDLFYNVKLADYERRLENILLVVNEGLNLDNFDEIVEILKDLSKSFRNLKWYSDLNYKGFIKILKKLDKRVNVLIEEEEIGADATVDAANDNTIIPEANEEDSDGKEIVNQYTHRSNLPFKSKQTYKETYLSTRVNALPFANGSDITKFLDTISSILNQLTTLKDAQQSPKSYPDLSLIKINSFDLNYQNYIHQLIVDEETDQFSVQLQEKEFDLKFLVSCLHKSALSNSKCLDTIWNHLVKKYDQPLFDEADISGRNFFHQYIVNLHKKSLDLTVSIAGLARFVDLVDPKFYPLLNKGDNYSKSPLHYISQYGHFTLINYWLRKLHELKIIDNIPIDDEEFWADHEGLTPLHLSIINNHPRTTESLIKNSKLPLSCPQLLLIAVRFNIPDILDFLINLGQIDVDYTDMEHHHETALYIACKLNLYESVEFLLLNSANPGIGESVFGWTPIFIAANEGFEAIVKLLIEFNAKYDTVDESGWLPMEHACLRGHLQVADLLKPQESDILLYDMYHPENNIPRAIPAKSPLILNNEELLKSSSSIDVLPEHSKKAIDQVYKQLRGNGTNGNGLSNPSVAQAELNKKKLKNLKPLKSFGHRYLNPDESLILITLGTTDLRDHSLPIDLNKFNLTKSFDNELDTALSLLITCKLKVSDEIIELPTIIDLPLEDHHGSATDPITFQLPDKLSIDDIIITFDLIPTYQYPAINKKNKTGNKVFGRAIALLKDAYTKVGPNLRSLNNNITVPILEAASLNILGSIRFEYMLITPFTHPEMSITSSDTYWKQLVSTRVIGHRGLGKNVNLKKSLQLGENTVESFIAAASLGASYVEFDVQLTKDYVPVVYHDFLVAESGVDIPMHALTAEQFLGLKDDTRKAMKEKEQEKKYALDDELIAKKSNRPRSMSTYPSAPNFHAKKSKTELEEQDAQIEREVKNQSNTRMKLTKTWKEQGFKGNTRGMSIASDFVTLKELFKKLPKTVGFNIELKYPMLDEAEQESMGEISIDRNFYVDTILKEIYDCNTDGRDIILSSFHPDICLLASLKQPNIPILFLTEAGTQFMADIRASSLQNAIRFAKKWNLLGIVSAAETLVKTPRLAQVVKSSGLVCVTYGTLNNEPELAKIQMKAGVDAVIVDSVLGVREGIRNEQEALNQLELNTPVG